MISELGARSETHTPPPFGSKVRQTLISQTSHVSQLRPKRSLPNLSETLKLITSDITSTEDPPALSYLIILCYQTYHLYHSHHPNSFHPTPPHPTPPPLPTFCPNHTSPIQELSLGGSGGQFGICFRPKPNPPPPRSLQPLPIGTHIAVSGCRDEAVFRPGSNSPTSFQKTLLRDGEGEGGGLNGWVCGSFWVVAEVEVALLVWSKDSPILVQV